MMIDFIAGVFGGGAGVLVGHPFDTVKVRLQTQNCTKPLYRGTFHCFRSIIKSESALGLYKGMSSPLATISFTNAVVFGVYGHIFRSFQSQNVTRNTFLAGAAAGTVQSFITTPVELAKTKLQLQAVGKETFRNPIDCLRKVHKFEGFRGLFRGLTCTILRDAPGFGIYFSSYHLLLKHAFGTDNDNDLGIAGLFLSGGIAGILSWVLVYPADVIKSRLQADGLGSVKIYKGLNDCITKSYRDEGLRFFTRGLGSTVIRAFPTNAATLAVATIIIMYYDKQTSVGLSKEVKEVF